MEEIRVVEFNPPYNQVILEKIEESERMIGNIVMPSMGEEGTIHAKVVAAGPGWVTISNQLIPTCVKVGDEVMIPRVGGFSISFDNKKYIACKDTDILTKITYTKEKE